MSGDAPNWALAVAMALVWAAAITAFLVDLSHPKP